MGAIVARALTPLTRACIYSSHVHRDRRDATPWLGGVEVERDGVNRWTNGGRLGRTLAERTRSVNGFIFRTEKRTLAGKSRGDEYPLFTFVCPVP